MATIKLIYEDKGKKLEYIRECPDSNIEYGKLVGGMYQSLDVVTNDLLTDLF